MKNVKGPLLVKVTLVNATKKAQFGFWPPDNPEFGPYEDLKALYKDMKGEWGGKVSKMFRDVKKGDKWEVVQVGWVFTKKMRYEDARGNGPDDYYSREAWVEVIRETAPAVDAEYETVAVGVG